MGKQKKKRVCNSEDPPEAWGEKCRYPAIAEHYSEIRIWAGTWEAAVMQGWLVQILLSELLEVPTSVETGAPPDRAQLNFYSATNRFEFGDDIQVIPSVQVAYDYQGDCGLRLENQTCSHFVPEIWNDLVSIPEGKALVDNGVLEAPLANGIKGKEGWFVTKFTVEEDPSLVSYFGMQGLDRNNRLRLAETFLRPTTFKHYCDFISSNNCTTDDGVAARPPQDQSEFDRMFVDGVYTGYFRSNECDVNGTDLSTCTGHIAGK
jgi:hypothetical protein